MRKNIQMILIGCAISVSGCSEDGTNETQQKKQDEITTSSEQNSTIELGNQTQSTANQVNIALPVEQASSTEDKSLQEEKYLGSKLIKLAGDITGVSPSVKEFKEIFSGCNFSDVDITNSSGVYQGHYDFTKSCEVKNIAVESESVIKDVGVVASTPHVGVGAVKIEREVFDGYGDIRIFDNLSGVTKKEINCPDIDDTSSASFGTMHYLLEKNGQPKFIVREDYNSGSGGSSRTTTIYFAKTNTDCKLFKDIETNFSEVNAVINSSKVGKTKNSINDRFSQIVESSIDIAASILNNRTYEWKDSTGVRSGIPTLVQRISFDNNATSCSYRTRFITEDAWTEHACGPVTLNIEKYIDTGNKYLNIKCNEIGWKITTKSQANTLDIGNQFTAVEIK
jgi:hypothetical protein